MNPLFAILLAQRNRLENLGDTFRGRSNPLATEDILTLLLVLTAIVVVLWLLSRFLLHRERPRGYHSPWRLFLALCRAHRVRWSDRWLLWRLARAQELADPARLFLEPQRLDASRMGADWQSQVLRLKQLRGQLFMMPPEKKPPPQSEVRETTVAATANTPLLPIVSSPALDVPPWPAAR